MESVSSETIKASSHGFEALAEERYGRGFVESYRSSKIHSPHESLRESTLPMSDKAMSILHDATSFRFVEWNEEGGGTEWRYVVTTSEARPDDQGTYSCQKVFQYDTDGKKWVQEVTKVNNEQTLPLYERVTKAVKKNLVSAITERLGFRFHNQAEQAGYVDNKKIESLPMGQELLKILPKKGVRVKYIEDTSHDNQELPGTDRNSREALVKAHGQNFEKSYSDSPTLRLDRLADEDAQKLAGLDNFKKDVPGIKKDTPFKYVEWVDDNGRPQFAYVVDWFANRESGKKSYFQIITAHNDEKGRFDYKSSYHPYSTNESINTRKEPYYIVEQDLDNRKFVNILRPSKKDKKGFDCVFIGIVDKNTDKCLVFNDIYPDVTFIQTSDSKKAYGYGCISVTEFPTCILSGLDLTSKGNFLSQMAYGKMEPGIVIPHELGHNEETNRKNRGFSKRLKEYIPTLGRLLYTLSMPTLVATAVNKYPELLRGNFDALIAGGLVLIGNTIYKDMTNEMETTADRNAKLLVQAARESGVDVANGKPDHKLALPTRLTVARITMGIQKLLSKFRLPV